MRSRALLVPLGCLALSGCGSPTPEMTAQQLMAERVQPTAEIYWDAVRYESELVDGEAVERNIVPQTDADWQKIEAAAVELQNLGELLQTSAYTEGRGEDWATFAQAMVDVSRRAEEAAKARDPDAVFEVGGTIYSVCSACHQVYPPAAGIPGEGA